MPTYRDRAMLVLYGYALIPTERGLTFSEEKTRVFQVAEGFTFLSRTYVKKDGLIYTDDRRGSRAFH